MKKPYRFWKRKDKGGVVYVQFASDPGRWISSGYKDRTQAVLWAEAYSPTKPRHDVIFADFASGFFDEQDPHGWRRRMDKKNKTRSKIWYLKHKGHLKNYILPTFGRKPLKAITTREIDNWYIEIVSVRKGKPASDNTKNRILSTLNIIMQEAEDQQIIDKNPIRNLEKITERNETRKTFTREELIKLFPLDTEECIRIWKSLSWYLYFRIMAVCGLRPSEVSALHWEDYYPDAKGLVIRRSIDSAKNLKGLKTENKGRREKIGYLDDKTAMELNRLQKKSSGEGLIFRAKKASFISAETALKHLRWCAPSAGVELADRTSYSFRHTFDTEMLRKLDRDTVNDLMGHTSYRQEYDHRTGEEILEQRKAVRDIINGSF